MSTIAVTDARGLFTKKLVAVYRQMITPTDFLRSFFRVVEAPTKEISIEVQRGFEKVAVDVIRGTEGNRNSFSKSTEKIFVPPMYREYFDITQLSLYDRLFGSTMIDGEIMAALVQDAASKLKMLQDTIERAIEVQCAQVLTTGIITLDKATSIDYKRKAASLVDLGGGSYWASVDPAISIEAGCNFLRQTGKATGAIFDMIVGSAALNDLINNTAVQNRGKIFNWSLDTLTTPQRNAAGASLHGYLSAGSYMVRIWTYNQFYDVVTNGVTTSTPYIDPKKAILLPENPNFVLAFGAVPQIVNINGGQLPLAASYVTGEYIDERNTAHILDIKSAPVAIPIAVDHIYTFKVVA